ncbi:class I mannose-6-phosphate isomerase [Enterococcus sp. BWB1-3]|uniref:class I mannose-6-phosphate isomerase n=1 Tax=Enterococcus sp. BWB1-3 TaxID=2787713 RepID=UPI0019224A87|nr:class I mannose-6-phosphate isomerase [Enterococcus sp. BWB1-3]MBL1229730.1 class I mannose-6-phosphate isomerase [Enterococcus sp. BWB1-3]
MKSSIVRPKIKMNKKASVLTTYEDIVYFIKQKSEHKKNFTLAIECYPVTNEQLLLEKIITPLQPSMTLHADELFIKAEEINTRIQENLTDDRIFGLMSHHKLTDFIDKENVKNISKRLEEQTKKGGFTAIYGMGASLLEQVDMVIYVDLARWEVQKRYRSGNYSNWLANNAGEDSLKMIKRGYFFEWPLADCYKQEIVDSIDYLLDIHDEQSPKLIAYDDYLQGLEEVVSQPFSLIPFFDPGVWGGTWMQKQFGVGLTEKNLAWSFNGVPEENSLLLDFSGTCVEVPANNLVFNYAEKLLGERAFGRFGHEFPIRFNFLDTMDGQNLSLQVHPKVDYAQKEFGVNYTQDESYYVLEAKNDAVVYLGVNEGVKKEELIHALKEAEKGETGFDDEKYIYRHTMAKHDHYSIPAGTIHSSGKDAVILEISATPNRFTFKLWDWDRVDFDGLPRPVNIDHGEPNIDIYKDEQWVKRELINPFTIIDQGEGWVEEKTGLHETEFIETRRHTFSKKVRHENHGSVNVLNLIEGDEALVTSPEGKFEPFLIQYAQTFIIPATIDNYEIEPCGASAGQTIKTIKAFVR